MEIIRQDEHYHEKRDWLDTDWHFSFGSYYDPDNTHFGPLRVFNNDRVKGGGGFPMHSHDNMEILTWIVRGELVHEDSTGSKSRIGRHEIQRMTAGTGISHSEYNGSETEECHLVQIWIEPREEGLEPKYEEDSFDDEHLRQGWVPVASGRGRGGVDVEQDATLFVTLVEPGEERSYNVLEDRKGYLVVMEGAVNLGGERLKAGDALRVGEQTELDLEADQSAELILLDLPARRVAVESHASGREGQTSQAG